MKVVLLEDFVNLGKKWDIVNVKDGFARNFLIPKKLARKIDEKNKREYSHLLKTIENQKEKNLKKFNFILTQLNEKILVMSVQTTEKGTLYSTIDAHVIAKFLSESVDKSISPEFLQPEVNIKETGSFKIFLTYNNEKKGYFWLYIVSN